MQKISNHNARKIQKQLFQYFFVGGIATIVDVGMFSLFSHFFLIDYRIAIVLGFIFGAFTNFSLCNWVVFAGNRRPLWLVFIRHYIASLSVLFINEISMITLVEFFAFDRLILAKIMSSGLAFSVNFFIKKIYVYNDSCYANSIKSNSIFFLIKRRFK